MSKPNVHSLSKMAFTKVVPTRKQKIADAPATPLPPIKSYKANELAAALHPQKQELKVAKVIERCADTKSYILVPDGDTKALAYFSAGQYISISLEIQGSVITRPYSLSSSPKEALEGSYMLTVRRAGLASNYILDTWAEGTKVLASAPLGDFTYEPLRDAKQIIGLAGGSGITPFRALAKAIVDGDEDVCLTLIYGSRGREDALFLDEFEAIAKQTNKFRLVNVFSDTPEEGREHGFITAELIKKYAPEGEYSLFICGPQAMYSFLNKEVPKLGLRRKFVRYELFGEYRHPEKDAKYTGNTDGVYELTVHICDEIHTIPCRADETLLVSMERAGIAAPAHCRSGVCGWCHSRLISGNVYIPATVDGRRLADKDYGYIHPCCTFPLGNIDLDVPPFKA